MVLAWVPVESGRLDTGPFAPAGQCARPSEWSCGPGDVATGYCQTVCNPHDATSEDGLLLCTNGHCLCAKGDFGHADRPGTFTGDGCDPRNGAIASHCRGLRYPG